MIVASKLPNGLVLGEGATLRGAMVGHEPHQKARAQGRERIASYEITRSIDDAVWARWYSENANGPIVQKKLVMGFSDGDDTALSEWCWANTSVRGWMQASRGDSS